MSFKISVPRTNYIKNTTSELRETGGGSPTGVNKGSDQDRNKNVGDRDAAASFGPSIDPQIRVVGDRFSGGFTEAPPSQVTLDRPPPSGVKLSFGGFGDPNEKSYTKVEDNGVLKPLCPVIESDSFFHRREINKNCLKYEQESVDYDILKLLKNDNQHLTNSFDLIKDIDDCGKINEIFNKMFCNIDNNTLRDQLSESLKNNKKVGVLGEAVRTGFFDAVTRASSLRGDHGAASTFGLHSVKQAHPLHGVHSGAARPLHGVQSSSPTGGGVLRELGACDPGTGRADSRSEGGGSDFRAAAARGSDVDQRLCRDPILGRPTGGESEANKKISFPESCPIGDGLFDRGAASSERGDRGAASCDPCTSKLSEGGDLEEDRKGIELNDLKTRGGDSVTLCETGVPLGTQASSFGIYQKDSSGSREEVVNTKVLESSEEGIKKKNPRRKKNKKNKRK